MADNEQAVGGRPGSPIPEEVQPPAKRFMLPDIKSESTSWELSEELAEFLQNRNQTYLQEKELEVFTTIQPPKNIKTATKLDPFMKALLDKKGLHKIVSQDNENQKIHERLFQVLGPLSSAWQKMQDVVNGGDEVEEIDPATVLGNLNDAVVILGQVINKVTYERRLSILAGLNDVKQAKSLIKDNVEDLNSESKFLFGECFQKHVKATAKAQDAAEKLMGKSSSTVRRRFPPNTRPNQQGPSTNHMPRGGVSRGRGFNRWNRGWNGRGRGRGFN
ncbi:uncharacterized protein [Clytia hemisphaerica]|uniref:uncharacterized protein n=1 Tax=Clytia hemisphaerica TaxID=252671 RepID=UPI0034D3EECF